jgi:hypothetical protein
VTAEATQSRSDAKGTFLFEVFLMSAATIGGVYITPNYLRALDICLEPGASTWMPWNSIGRGAVYCSLLICICCLLSVFAWWAREGSPWGRMNREYLSGEALPGIKAWQTATANLIASWRHQPRLARLANATIIAAFFSIVIAWLSLETKLRHCSKCAEDFAPTNCQSAAAVLTAALVLILYVDLRIKFKSRAP